MKPYVHLFETILGKYMYDVNTECIIKTNDWEYKEIENYLNNDIKTEYISYLISEGYLSDKRVLVTEHPATKRLESLYENKLSYLVLQLTQNCNMRCKYCIYSGAYNMRNHSNKKMNWTTAKKSIDYFLEHSIDSESIHIGFYGGEPLLEMELIKKCVMYIKNNAQEKEIIFNITTNGALLDLEVGRFLYEYKFMVTLSFDGPEYIHNRSRRFVNNEGTYAVVYNNILNLKNNFPDYFKNNFSVNAVVTTKDSFDDIEHFFTSSIFKEVPIATTFISNEYRKEKIHYSQEIVEKVKYLEFLEFLHIMGELEYSSVLMNDRYSKMLTFRQEKQISNYIRKDIPEKYHHGGPCIPGVKKLFVNVEGNFYPCEKICELSDEYLIGSIYNGIDLSKGISILNIEKQMESKCHNCWAYDLCDICAMPYFESKSEGTTEELCSRTRLKAEELLKDYCVYKELLARKSHNAFVS